MNHLHHEARWLILCQAIDNFGDIGVTWRLAKQLVREFAIEVELWVDDIEKAKLLGANSETHLTIRHWSLGLAQPMDEAFSHSGPGAADVVIAAFACATPLTLIDAMAKRQQTEYPTLWINLEYLSAEPWVQSSHLLKSPRQGLNETFFFPGWFEGTGGVLREAKAPAQMTKQALWDLLAIDPKDNDSLRNNALQARWFSLFCYPQAPVSELVQKIRESNEDCVLWVPDGVANKTLDLLELFAHPTSKQIGQNNKTLWFKLGKLLVLRAPFINQDQYDSLLSVCDLNFVRGEDSLVRALWAGKPFVWHIYPQEESAHTPKLNAFLVRVLFNRAVNTISDLKEGSEFNNIAIHHWWNAIGKPASIPLCFELNAFALQNWQDQVQRCRENLLNQDSLAQQLVNFAKSQASCPQ